MNSKPKSNSEDWQLRCAQTRQRLSHLLSTGLWSDCKFVVGAEIQETVCAHKFVLAMTSPVFEAMFFGGMSVGDNDGPIAVTDVQPEAFKTLLEYVYTDKVSLKSFNAAGPVYYAAKKYMLRELQRRCVLYMALKLTPSNALYAYEFAVLFDDKELKDAALKKIQAATKEVLKEANFEDVRPSTLQTIVKLDQLKIVSELDLFLALEKWALASGVRNLKRSNGPEDVKRIKLDEEKKAEKYLEVTKSDEDVKGIISRIRPAVSSIRFLTLNLEETAELAQSVLLTEEEALVLLVRAAGGTADLPATICGSLEKREPLLLFTQSQIPDSNVETYEAMQMFSIYNFRTRKRIVESPRFYTDRLKWHIRAVPGREPRQIGDVLEYKMLGLDVCCELENVYRRGWGCDGDVSIEVIAKNGKNFKTSFTHRFSWETSVFSFTPLLWWDDLVDNYLVSNTIDIQVKVIASRIVY